MKTLVLCSSPRRNSNSTLLAKEVAVGLEETGHEVILRDLNTFLGGFLGDCRQCRLADGSCAIKDRYRELFFNDFLPAEGLIVATPIYWYGMSAQLKAFFDRMFCYVAASHPASEHVLTEIQGKRIGLVLSSEETFPTVSGGIVHQLQEYSRYTSSTFVGAVHGYGNAGGEVARDPRDPISAARRFGQKFFTTHATDYRIDTPRSGTMWPKPVSEIERCASAS
ncbi:MAG: flavodoxin family protein [Pseudomonadota bacterium]